MLKGKKYLSAFTGEVCVTRFAEISSLWHDVTNFVHFETVHLVPFWQNFEIALVNFLCFWATFHCCKWPKIEQTIRSHCNGYQTDDTCLWSAVTATAAALNLGKCVLKPSLRTKSWNKLFFVIYEANLIWRAEEDDDQCDQIGRFIGLWATF